MKTEKLIEGIKTAIGIIVGIGTSVLCSAFAGNIASQNNMKSVEKICAGVAGGVVGAMLGEKASEYVDSTVDHMVKVGTVIGGIAKELHNNPEGDAENA